MITLATYALWAYFLGPFMIGPFPTQAACEDVRHYQLQQGGNPEQVSICKEVDDDR